MKLKNIFTNVRNIKQIIKGMSTIFSYCEKILYISLEFFSIDTPKTFDPSFLSNKKPVQFRNVT